MTNLIPKDFDVCLLATHIFRRVTNVIIPSPRTCNFFVSRDVTFEEVHSYYSPSSDSLMPSNSVSFDVLKFLLLFLPFLFPTRRHPHVDPMLTSSPSSNPFESLLDTDPPSNPSIPPPPLHYFGHHVYVR